MADEHLTERDVRAEGAARVGTVLFLAFVLAGFGTLAVMSSIGLLGAPMTVSALGVAFAAMFALALGVLERLRRRSVARLRAQNHLPDPDREAPTALSATETPAAVRGHDVEE